VASPDHKYVLDTHLFIQGFREPGANEALQRFHVRHPGHFETILPRHLREDIARPMPGPY
jgi:hypothetical protein